MIDEFSYRINPDRMWDYLECIPTHSTIAVCQPFQPPSVEVAIMDDVDAEGVPNWLKDAHRLEMEAFQILNRPALCSPQMKDKVIENQRGEGECLMSKCEAFFKMRWKLDGKKKMWGKNGYFGK